MGLFSNPLGYAGYPPDAGPPATVVNSTVRAATLAEANAGTLTNVYISPATEAASVAVDFASPPVDGFGSTTKRPVHATTLESTLNTSLANTSAATTFDVFGVAPVGARTAVYHGGNAAVNDTASWFNGNPSAGTQSFLMFGGVPTGGTQLVGFFTGNASGGTQSFSVLTGTRAGTLNLGTGAAAHSVTIGSSVAKVGFFGATTIVKTTSTTDLKTSLVNYGLVTGGGATPLNLNGGTLTAANALLTTAGATIGLAVDTSSGTGIGATITTLNGVTDAIQLINGSIKVPAPTITGATPQVNSVRTGQVGFTDTVGIGGYLTVTLTNTIVTGSSIIIAVASCAKANTAVHIATITPGSGSVAFSLFNAGSADTSTSTVFINFWVLN